MILTSTTETLPFTPKWREGSDDAPVFHLRAAGVIERGQMEAELAGTHRAGQVYGFELMAAIRSGVQTLLAEDPQLDRLLELIEAEATDAASLTDEDKRLLAGVREILAEHWPDYQMLHAQIERRRAIAPIVALRRFCAGIDAKGVTFATGRDGLVTEETLRTVDPLELMAAGNRAYALAYGAGAEKNSASPPSSGGDPKTSVSDEPSREDGASTDNAST